MNNVKCDYCGDEAHLVTGEHIYPHRDDLKHLRFWQCVPCGAHVGVHRNSKEFKPLGRLADKELRMWKQNAHMIFDPIWKSGEMSRTEAYQWLSKHMGLPYHQCHIGMMDVDECKQLVEVCKTKRKSHRHLHLVVADVRNILSGDADPLVKLDSIAKAVGE